MNVTYGFFSVLDKCWYDPRKGGKNIVYGFDFPRLDWVRFRLAMTYGKVRLASNSMLPATGDQWPITDQSSSLFTLKSQANYLQDANGPLDFTNGGGFDASDTDWNRVGVGLVTLAPIVIPLTVPTTQSPVVGSFQFPYNMEIILLKTNQRWTLYPDDLPPLEGDVKRDVYTGQESNAPSGLPGSLSGSWSISNGSLYTDVSITGTVTINTLLALGVSPATGGAGDVGTITQTPNTGNNTVRLSVGSAPGQGGSFNGVWTLLNL